MANENKICAEENEIIVNDDGSISVSLGRYDDEGSFNSDYCEFSSEQAKELACLILNNLE